MHRKLLALLIDFWASLLIARCLTGWLPGPGGIRFYWQAWDFSPLNHEWRGVAKKIANQHEDSVTRSF